MHVSVVHFSLVLVLFWKVLIQDPGTLGPGDADPRFSGIADLVENNENPQRFCIYCEVSRTLCPLDLCASHKHTSAQLRTENWALRMS